MTTTRISREEIRMLIDALDERYAQHRGWHPELQRRYEVLVSKLHDARRAIDMEGVRQLKAEMKEMGWDIRSSGDGDGEA